MENIYQRLGLPVGSSLDKLNENIRKYEAFAENNPSEATNRILEIIHEQYELLIKDKNAYDEICKPVVIKKEAVNANVSDDNVAPDRLSEDEEMVKILERFEQSQDIKHSKKPTNSSNRKKNFKLYRADKKRKTKNVSISPLKKVVISTGLALGVISVFATVLLTNGDVIDRSPKVTSTIIEQTTTDEQKTKEDLVFIEYEVMNGDTKTKIINKLELSKEEANKIPVDIYINQTYRLRVKEEIADAYNYEYKTTKKKVFSYELPSGGSLFDIADYALEEYSEIFGGLTRNQIVSQIASDNNCTVSRFPAGTYTIYFHAPQKEIDELTNEGLLPNLNNSMHTN